MAIRYYNDSASDADGDIANPDNWFSDQGNAMPLGDIPAATDDAVFQSAVTSGTLIVHSADFTSGVNIDGITLTATKIALAGNTVGAGGVATFAGSVTCNNCTMASTLFNGNVVDVNSSWSGITNINGSLTMSGGSIASGAALAGACQLKNVSVGGVTITTPAVPARGSFGIGL